MQDGQVSRQNRHQMGLSDVLSALYTAAITLT